MNTYLIAPSVDGDVEDGLREPLGGGVLVRGVEPVVGDGVAEYAELAAFEGGQCSLLKEIIPVNHKFRVSESMVA